MSRRRPRPVPATLAAATGLVLLATQVGGVAGAPTGQRAPAVGEVGHALIQGKVVDLESGKPIDDVRVQAVRQKEVKGTTGASDLTYASPDNAIKHGYFAMHVPHGTYTVTFSKKDYAPVEREVRRKKGARAGIGEVLLRLLPATTMKIGSSRVPQFRVGKDVVLKVGLDSRAKGRHTGTVRILRGGPGGEEVARADLGPQDRDLAVLRLGRAKEAGTQHYTVVYSGDETFRSATQGVDVLVKQA